VDDDPAAGEYLEEGGDTEEEIARRRLSYSAQSRNGVTGGLRAFMLETREQN